MAATHKIVNGVSVPLSGAEIAAIEAEWAANPPPTAAQLLQQLKDRVNTALNQDDAEDNQKLRAVALALLAEINTLRDSNSQLLSAIAVATSLADLKTRASALPALPQRTAAQLRSAVLNLLG